MKKDCAPRETTDTCTRVVSTRTSRGSCFFRGVYKHVLSAVARRSRGTQSREGVLLPRAGKRSSARICEKKDRRGERSILEKYFSGGIFFQRADERAKSDSWVAMCARFPAARRVSPVDNRVRRQEARATRPLEHHVPARCGIGSPRRSSVSHHETLRAMATASRCACARIEIPRVIL